MNFISENVTVFAVIALVIVALAIFGFVAGRIKRVPPNSAMVIVGRGAGNKAAEPDAGQRVVIGGRVFIWPILQQGFLVSLEQRQIGIAVEGVPSLGARAVAVIAWLAVVNTALAYAMWNVALRQLTATEASALNTAMVIQIPLLAWLFLGEGLGPPEIAGILVVAAGVFGMREGRRR